MGTYTFWAISWICFLLKLFCCKYEKQCNVKCPRACLYLRVKGGHFYSYELTIAHLLTVSKLLSSFLESINHCHLDLQCCSSNINCLWCLNKTSVKHKNFTPICWNKSGRLFHPSVTSTGILKEKQVKVDMVHLFYPKRNYFWEV